LGYGRHYVCHVYRVHEIHSGEVARSWHFVVLRGRLTMIAMVSSILAFILLAWAVLHFVFKKV